MPSYPSAVEWIFLKYIYIIEFHSVVKKNEIMTCEGKWLQLVIITLSKITWSQKWPRHRKTNTAHIFSYMHRPSFSYVCWDGRRSGD